MRARKPGVIRSQSLRCMPSRGAETLHHHKHHRARAAASPATHRGINVSAVMRLLVPSSRVANECAPIGMRDLYGIRGLAIISGRSCPASPRRFCKASGSPISTGRNSASSIGDARLLMCNVRLVPPLTIMLPHPLDGDDGHAVVLRQQKE